MSFTFYSQAEKTMFYGHLRYTKHFKRFRAVHCLFQRASLGKSFNIQICIINIDANVVCGSSDGNVFGVQGKSAAPGGGGKSFPYVHTFVIISSALD